MIADSRLPVGIYFVTVSKNGRRDAAKFLVTNR